MKRIIVCVVLAVAGIGAAEPQDSAVEARQRAEQARERAKQDALERAYERGQRALDQRQYEEAAKAFADAAKAGSRVDGALYWQAYAQSRLGQSAEALRVLSELEKVYAESRWLMDAKALEIEIRQAEGKPISPEAQADDELKLLALYAVMRSDPDKAIPIIEKMLQGPGSPRIKERALFVLMQNNSPRAREVVVNVARGGSNPDLQRAAIRSLGVLRAEQSRDALVEIYPQVKDAEKREILNALFVLGAADKLVAIARSETNAALKREAVSKLSIMKSKEATDYMMELLSK